MKSNLVSLTYYIYSTVQRYDKEREKTNKFRFYLNFYLHFLLDTAYGSVLIDLVHFIVFLFVYLEIMLNFVAD